MREILVKGSMYWAGMVAGWAIHFKDWRWIPFWVIALVWYVLAERKLRVL